MAFNLDGSWTLISIKTSFGILLNSLW